jgi:WD40 repeat protein
VQHKVRILSYSSIFLIAFCLGLSLAGCVNNSSEKSKNRIHSKRIELEPVWTNLGIDEGAADMEIGHAAIESAEFSSNEKYIVSSARLGRNLKVWDTYKGELIFDFISPGELRIAIFSPDNKFLLAGGEFNQVLIWRVADWNLIKTIEFEGSVEGMQFSRDQKLLAVGDKAGMITLIDANNFNIIKSVHQRENRSTETIVPRSDINSLVFSTGNEYLITGSIDGQIKIWFVPDLKLIKTLDSGTSSIKSVRINQKGNCIASASTASEWGDENAIKMWDFSTGDLMHTLTFPDGVEAVEFSPVGNYLFCGGGGKIESNRKSRQGYIYVYYIPEDILMEPIKQVYRENVFRSKYLHINKSGTKMVTAHEDGTVRLWNIIHKK